MWSQPHLAPTFAFCCRQDCQHKKSKLLLTKQQICQSVFAGDDLGRRTPCLHCGSAFEIVSQHRSLRAGAGTSKQKRVWTPECIQSPSPKWVDLADQTARACGRSFRQAGPWESPRPNHPQGALTLDMLVGFQLSYSDRLQRKQGCVRRWAAVLSMHRHYKWQ